ncbi:hypothetical protein NQ318_001756 [Aromia moschata]|uniref:Enamelin n=1 Tax=Aromia moschata TaxID=1265417 RepID=A0AAV8XUG2_9CUCU|nr:hypothetical protein NQ318_001756 [Aromia moschata]
MERNNNWRNYQRNVPRGRPFNNRGGPRPYVNRGNVILDNDLPPPYTSSGNRQNNPHGNFGNERPTYSREAYQNSYPKQFKTKSFPQNRPHHSRYTPYQRRYQSCPPTDPRQELTVSTVKELTPLEAKVEKLIKAVQSQPGYYRAAGIHTA